MEIFNKIKSMAKSITEVGVGLIALAIVLEVLFKGQAIPFLLKRIYYNKLNHNKPNKSLAMAYNNIGYAYYNIKKNLKFLNLLIN